MVALAAIGIYDVIACSTAQRIQEIGIRMALGASGADILTMVLKEGVMIGAVGLTLGIAAALVVWECHANLQFALDTISGREWLSRRARA